MVISVDIGEQSFLLQYLRFLGLWLEGQQRSCQLCVIDPKQQWRSTWKNKLDETHVVVDYYHAQDVASSLLIVHLLAC